MQAPTVFDAAQHKPAGLAVLGSDGPLSYAELASAVSDAMGVLRSQGVESGEPVGLLARPTVASLVCLLALSELRAPMVLVHPRTPDRERARLLDRAGARLWFAPDRAGLEPGRYEADVTRRYGDVFAIAPTSGSTGTPKLVLLGRRAIAASAAASVRHIALRGDDRWLVCLPLAHVGGLSIVTRSLAARSTIVLHDAGERGLLHDVGALAAALHAHGVTIVSLVPTVLDALLAHDPAWRPPVTLRATLVGGAASPHALLVRARDAGFFPLTTYGLTEACAQVTAMPLGAPLSLRDGVVSAGSALPGVEVALDAADRIRIRGPNLCSGFVDAEAPIDADGWFLTEDLGRFDEHGRLYVVGRASERIVTGGENVDPLTVEAALEDVAGVERICVFGLPDARFGEIVVAALVCSSEFDRAEFDSRARDALARHERPRKVTILPAFPLLPNGKVDRARARALAVDAFGCES